MERNRNKIEATAKKFIFPLSRCTQSTNINIYRTFLITFEEVYSVQMYIQAEWALGVIKLYFITYYIFFATDRMFWNNEDEAKSSSKR